jgi:hypothetical protein
LKDYVAFSPYQHQPTINASVTTRHKLIEVNSLPGAKQIMVGTRKLAEEILIFFHEQDNRGKLNVTMASLYKAFEDKASYDGLQRAVSFLIERDFIAPYSYSLTAKGRREHSLKRKS